MARYTPQPVPQYIREMLSKPIQMDEDRLADELLARRIIASREAVRWVQCPPTALTYCKLEIRTHMVSAKGPLKAYAALSNILRKLRIGQFALMDITLVDEDGSIRA